MNVKALPLAKRLIRCGTIAAITATLVTALIPGEVAAQAGAVARKVSLRSANGKFICAEGGGGGAVVANRGALGAWETFTLHDLNGGNLVDGDKVTLQAANGKFVCAEGGGGGAVVANRGAVGAWETFTFRRIGTATAANGGIPVALQAVNGKYVCAEGGGGGVVNATRTAAAAWETFTLTDLGAVASAGAATPPPATPPAAAPVPVTGAPPAVANKPRIAVLEFANKSDNQFWFHGGAEATQDVFVAELVRGDKFNVVDREQLEAIMREKNLTLSGELNAATAIRVGKLLGVNYLLTGDVTEYGVAGVSSNGSGNARPPGFNAPSRSFVAAVKARLIDTSTGQAVWTDEARGQTDSTAVSVGGVGGGAADQQMFDKVMKPVIQTLAVNLLKSR